MPLLCRRCTRRTANFCEKLARKGHTKLRSIEKLRDTCALRRASCAGSLCNSMTSMSEDLPINFSFYFVLVRSIVLVCGSCACMSAELLRMKKHHIVSTVSLILPVLSRPHITWSCGCGPVCTCHVYGIQQQCQHTLFVEGLQPPLPEVVTRRDFNIAFSTRRPGRPKGKAKPAPRRRTAQTGSR
jgi:hypothetical protein